MKNPWLRLYAEFAFDPKIQSMSETFQRRFIMLLCLKCNDDLKNIENDEIAFALRISIDELSETKQLFMKKNFIDNDWNFRTWDKRQFKSDTSTNRVRKHREKQQVNDVKRYGNVSVTPPDTDTDTEIKNKKNIKKKKFDLVSFRPDWIPDKLWLSFLENRKFKKLQNSELALTTILRAIKKAVDAGYSVESCIGQFVTSGWKRFNVDWMKDNGGQIQPRTVREALIVTRDQMAGEVLKQQRETKYDESTDPHETVDQEVSRHRANLPQLPLS